MYHKKSIIVKPFRDSAKGWPACLSCTCHCFLNKKTKNYLYTCLWIYGCHISNSILLFIQDGKMVLPMHQNKSYCINSSCFAFPRPLKILSYYEPIYAPPWFQQAANSRMCRDNWLNAFLQERSPGHIPIACTANIPSFMLQN